MPSSRTRYTKRCSWVIRRDQVLGARYLRGSGLPIPAKGSRRMASTRSRTRRTALRSSATQDLRSSMNSGWKTASRVFLLKAHLRPELGNRHRPPPALEGASERLEQARGIGGGAQEVGRLGEADELVGRDQSGRLPIATVDDDDFPIARDNVQERRQFLAGL